jgi:hypothetical protein
MLFLVLMPIFCLGLFPMLLMALIGVSGLCILGILMICVGLADSLNAHGDFNRDIVVHGFARPSERTRQASHLRRATRRAAWSAAAGAGLLIAGLAGALAS